MQNRYVVDAGDFGKYGLLRRLTGLTDPDALEPHLRLGVVWYLTPDGCCNREGGHTRYLEPGTEGAAFGQAADLELWCVLRGLLTDGNRCVHGVQQSILLPDNAQYYDAMLHLPADGRRELKKSVRTVWLYHALKETDGADLVYLDPDIGIWGDEARMYWKGGTKYTYESDIRTFWERGQSLVIYQDATQGPGSVLERAQTKTAWLRRWLGAETVFALNIKLEGNRTFFVVSQPEHRERIRGCVERMLASPWSRRFVRLEV